MPHVIVQLWLGSSEVQKKLADAITKDVVRYTNCVEVSISVAVEEVISSDWKDHIYSLYYR
jgi:phenylpyruvate tautomerase PptA (4-oxalocrotonate tautomerase family)